MPTGYHPGLYNEIHEERLRQIRLHAEGRFETTPSEMENTLALTVLVEEVGEVARAILEKRWAHDVHGKDLRKELVQVAAVCVAWIEGLDQRGGQEPATAPKPEPKQARKRSL